MSFMTKLVSMIMSLPPAPKTKLEYQIDLKVPMADGVILLANRIAPVGGESLPIILIRDPYAYRGNKPDIISQVIAERGYQVVYQNCRGRWGSEGVFEPFCNERKDGLDTLKWIALQPWFSGSIGMYGLSYWGYAQLALGAEVPDYVKALVPQMSASKIHHVFRSNGTLSLFTTLSWLYSTYVTNTKEKASNARKASKQQEQVLQKVFMQLPIGDADKVISESSIPFFQDIIQNENETDEFWKSTDFSKEVKDISAPVHFMDGWFDFFLTDQLADYEAMHSSGKEPYLTIGPWTHAELPGLKAGLKESLLWYDAYLRGNTRALRELPVRIYIMGRKKWVDLPSWPPKTKTSIYYLKKGGMLEQEAPQDIIQPSKYTYNPANPTPSIGGSIITGGGSKDNSKIEMRADVLVFTSEIRKEELTIIGTVSIELIVRSTNKNTDFFARLCDVSPKGRSCNICDGIIRLKPEQNIPDELGIQKITIELQPTAYCFKAGHRIRLQVSSGAHPLFIRNNGTDEPIKTGTDMKTAEQEVFHDKLHLSKLSLPVVQI